MGGAGEGIRGYWWGVHKSLSSQFSPLIGAWDVNRLTSHRVVHSRFSSFVIEGIHLNTMNNNNNNNNNNINNNNNNDFNTGSKKWLFCLTTSFTRPPLAVLHSVETLLFFTSELFNTTGLVSWVKRSVQTWMKEVIQTRKFTRLGHTLWRPSQRIFRQVLTWNPQGGHK